MGDIDKNNYPIGYAALVEQFKLSVIPHFRYSYIALQGGRRVVRSKGSTVYFYDKGYALEPDAGPLEHIAFSLKHEGMNLEIIKACFEHIKAHEVEKYVASQPTGKYARMIWYLYESLTSAVLKIVNIDKGSYVYLLNPKHYYTAKPIKQLRYRIYDNLLGNFTWCPFVRRTPLLEQFEKKQINVMAQDVLKKYPHNIQQRATSYMYIKETRSSYALEHEQPSTSRMDRFIKLLSNADKIKHLNKPILVELQNNIVEPRFANHDYRSTQNYIGEDVIGEHIIHYISPKPSDVPVLMNGLLASMDRMLASKVSPVIIAAAISFGFVYIHPFDDGNGRLHRFIIHYLLRITEFIKSNTIIPISATMLNDRKAYDDALECFSKPLLLVLSDYNIDASGRLSIQQGTLDYYQYIDCTSMAEFLFSCLETTITTQLPQELLFLVSYDKTKHALQNIVDMPDNKIDLVIKLILQNKGHLASSKRTKLFSMLTDKEIADMEHAVQKYMSNSLRN